MHRRPNILLLQSDQHRFDCLGSSGHPLVRTPHLDRLAACGIAFSQAYSPIPVCVPARTSLLHGCWPSRHGCVVNEALGVPHPDTRDLPSFSAQLGQVGYRLGHVGKWQHSQNIGAPEFGFESCVSRDGYPRWRSAGGRAPRPHTNSWFGECDPHVGPAESRSAWEADQVIDMVRSFKLSGRPFFVRWDMSEPHLPNIVPEPFASLYSPSRIDPWPSWPDDLRGKPFIQAQQRRTWHVEHFTWEDWAPIVARYLGEISLLDAQIGRVMHALNTLDIADETLVVYTSDHGGLCGGHGMIDKHYVMYDDVVRVPLIVSWPGRIRQPGRISESFVIHGLDLARTFCVVGGASVPGSFQGQSLVPVFDGAGETRREDVFGVYYGGQFGLYTQRMVRNRQWKYVWNATAGDELYHLENDPGGLRNRARDPGCANILNALRRRLVAWMDSSGDQQLNPWTRDQLLGSLTR